MFAFTESVFSTRPVGAFADWILVAVLCHLVIAFVFVRSFKERLLGSDFWLNFKAMKKGMCPHRRARWLKCNRPSMRRLKTEHEDWPCPFESAFWKLHMPPPLPLHRKHKRCTVTTTLIISKDEDIVSLNVELVTSPPSTTTAPQLPSLQEERIAGKQNLMPVAARPTVVQTSLIDLARMQRWDSVKVHAKRRGAKHHDSDGLYPLHWACSGAPPVDAIQALLTAYQGAARKVDNVGSTALHFAAHYGASASVVEIVLKAYEPALRKQDKYGRTPLFHAVAKAAGLDVLRILLSADPSMVTKPCIPPTKTKGRLRSDWVKRTPLYLGWAAVLSDRQTRQKKAGKVWEKAQLLLEAAYTYHYRDARPSIQRVYRILHTTISLDWLLPPGVVELAIQARPNEIQEPDEVDGRLPLAVAASSMQASPERSDALFKRLIEAYPAATRAVDAQGRTPLVLAVKAGKTWDAGVGRLFEADPDVIDWYDPVTGLSPIALAATVVECEYECEDHAFDSTSEDEEEDLMIMLPRKAREWHLRARETCGDDSSSLSSSSSSSLSCLLPDQEGDSSARRLSTIFQLLQANPSVVI